MIKIKKLYKEFGSSTADKVTVFEDFNLTLEDQQFMIVLGSNGSGKSTLLNLISGTLSPSSGDIKLQDKSITKLSEPKRAKSIARVFQDPLKGTCPNLTIEENMIIAYLRGKAKSLSFASTGKRRELFKEKLETLNLGLENRIFNKVGTLSGGQRQALSILMASLTGSKLFLLDEPTAALDPVAAKNILIILNQIVTDQNLTALMVTHDLNHAIEYGNRILMLNRGKIAFDISAKEKSQLNTNDLISKFRASSTDGQLSDKILLS